MQTKFFTLKLMLIMCCSLLVFPASANNECSAKDLKKDKITVCHKTNSQKNPIVKVCIKKKAYNQHSSNHSDFLPLTFYTDLDRDGFGDINAAPETDCIIPEGKVDNNLDCNDNDAAINPNANDNCNSLDMVDNNCDGIIDAGAANLYLDKDNDGDNAIIPTYGCDGSPVAGKDCDDNDNQVSSLVTEESCSGNGLDGKDNNCDGLIDPQSQLYVDNDTDSYGTGSTVQACPGIGFASIGGDCNDAVQSTNPGAIEICNDGVDNNCDGQVDENCEPVTVKCPCDDLELWNNSTLSTDTVFFNHCGSYPYNPYRRASGKEYNPDYLVTLSKCQIRSGVTLSRPINSIEEYNACVTFINETVGIPRGGYDCLL